MKNIFSIIIFVFLISTTGNLLAQTQQDTMYAYLTTTPVVIDGNDSDACWATAEWHPISKVWLPYYNAPMEEGDFSGQFKLAWDSLYLYLLVEVVDDSLSDDHVNPFTNYWDDDCVEIFIDENRSKGNHLTNNNAFAYHVSTYYDVIDGGTGTTVNLKDNLSVVMDTIGGHTYRWEFAIKNFDATFKQNNPEASRVYLHHNKLMGFSLAYCDNDETTGRENFIGSTVMPSDHSNDNYITADYFGTLLLVDPNYIDQTGISLFNEEITFTVFPNPVNDYLNIEMNASNIEISKLEIRDLNGKLMLQQSTSSDVIHLFVGELKGGLYFARLISENGVYTKSFVKMN
ncbi:MAG: sugar-binding protein [Prolixibacteraceae bacterium]